MTLLFYVDESRSEPYHVHAGVLGDGSQVDEATAELSVIVERAYRNKLCATRDAEIHGSAVFGRSDGWSGSCDDRIAIFDQVLSLLDKLGIEVISRGIRVPDFRRKYANNDPYPWGFSNLLERVDERLTSRGEYGLVIADEQAEFRERLRDDLAYAKANGTGGYRSRNLATILDTAHFVDSKRSRMVQLADVVAFVVRRRAFRPTEGDRRLERAVARWDGLIDAAVPEHKASYRSIWGNVGS